MYLNLLEKEEADTWDAEEQLHALARWSALSAAEQGHRRSGRGAVIVPWPPEKQLSVSFVPEAACAPLGLEVMNRVAGYDPSSQFVMIFLMADGHVDAYTYHIPRHGVGRAAVTVH